MAGNYDGKVVLITGASSGIGAVAARMFAERGAQVVAVARREALLEQVIAQCRAHSPNSFYLSGDVGLREFAESIVTTTVDRLGRLDVLVNNAGVQSKGSLLEVPLDDWHRQLSVYLTGPLLLTRAVARVLIAQGRPGSIINILSTSAHQGRPGTIAYCTAKGGQLNFTRAAAMDLAPYGIRVNAITPTALEHSVVQASAAAAAARPTFGATLTAEDFLRGIPLGRLPRTTDIAHAAVFLASDEASMITGHDLHVDGGALARYWAWVPGAARPVTLEEYRRTQARELAWGEERASDHG